MLAPGAAARDIALTYQGPDEPVYAYADAYRVETILVNLIGNAVKYTPQGGQIDVSLEVHETCLRVSVKDPRVRGYLRTCATESRTLRSGGRQGARWRRHWSRAGSAPRRAARRRDRDSGPRRRWVHLLVHAADGRASTMPVRAPRIVCHASPHEGSKRSTPAKIKSSMRMGRSSSSTTSPTFEASLPTQSASAGMSSRRKTVFRRLS